MGRDIPRAYYGKREENFCHATSTAQARAVSWTISQSVLAVGGYGRQYLQGIKMCRYLRHRPNLEETGWPQVHQGPRKDQVQVRSKVLEVDLMGYS